MKVFILTEAGKDIGYGHLTRCCALYDGFSEIGITPSLIVMGKGSFEDFLTDKKYLVQDWLNERKSIFNDISNADIAIIDSYQADSDFLRNLSEKVKTPAYLDDYMRLEFPQGYLINGSIYAENLGYPEKKGLTYLLGKDYTPLRKEFWNVDQIKISKKLNSVMIIFGGGDTANMTPQILKLLTTKYPGLKKKVVLRKEFEGYKDIEKLRDENTVFVSNVKAAEIRDLMFESDIAISAGGQTLFELARIGVPTISITVDENQSNNVKGWSKAGFLLHAGWYNDNNLLTELTKHIETLFSFKVRTKMSAAGTTNMSGTGVKNIIGELTKNHENRK